MDKITKKEKAPTAVKRAEGTKKTVNATITKKPKNVNPVFTEIFKAFGFKGVTK